MHRYALFIFLCLFIPAKIPRHAVVINSSDIRNFWCAFDSLITKDNDTDQEKIIQRLYLDRASPGLKSMIALRDWTPEKFRKSISQNMPFWNSVRTKTLSVGNQVAQIEELYKNYKVLYPNFIAPRIYFVIGFIETGGTTTQDQILIGTEIASADSTVDAQGLHPMIQRFMRSNQGIMPIIEHELTHTQQPGGDMETRRKSNLLGFCLAEGSCDLVAEILTGEPVTRPYMVYGREKEKNLWMKFQQEMHHTSVSDWLYNGGFKTHQDADMGYFMGYAICKSYYERATDKTQAIRRIISLDFEDIAGLDRFLSDSGYNPL